jgi:hypothetical protein
MLTEKLSFNDTWIILPSMKDVPHLRQTHPLYYSHHQHKIPIRMSVRRVCGTNKDTFIYTQDGWFPLYHWLCVDDVHERKENGFPAKKYECNKICAVLGRFRESLCRHLPMRSLSRLSHSIPSKPRLPSSISRSILVI